MKTVKMMKTAAGPLAAYEEGHFYEISDEIATAFVNDGAAIEYSPVGRPERAVVADEVPQVPAGDPVAESLHHGTSPADEQRLADESAAAAAAAETLVDPAKTHTADDQPNSNPRTEGSAATNREDGVKGDPEGAPSGGRRPKHADDTQPGTTTETGTPPAEPEASRGSRGPKKS